MFESAATGSGSRFMVEGVLRDIRHSLRLMRRWPGFAAVAIGTLALGISANTTMFAFVNTVLLKPLPYSGAERLVRIVGDVPSGDVAVARRGLIGMPLAQLTNVREGSRTLSHVGVYVNTSMTLTGLGAPMRTEVTRLSPAVLRMIGARPVRGRVFRDEEEAASSSVIVIAHALWQRALGGRADVLGQTLLLDGRPQTIVGVMAQDFQFPESRTQVWMPYVLDAFGLRATVAPVARLADGASPEAAVQELRELMPRLLGGDPAAARWATVDVVRWQEHLVQPVRPALIVLSAAVGFVLLIACANIGSILLARAASREGELALRLAVGARPGRIVQQLLTEILVLAVAGGVVGTALAMGTVRAIRALGATLPRGDLVVDIGIPRLQEMTIDFSVIGFTLTIAAGAGVLAGLVPALRQMNTQPQGVLRAAAGTSESGLSLFGAHRAQALLIVGQVALAMVLLIGGGLLLRSFINLSRVDPGYDARQVLTFNVFTASRNRPPTFNDTMVSRLESLPGVESAGYAELMPMVRFRVSGPPLRRASDRVAVSGAPAPEMHVVTPGFLKAMRVRVIEGRMLDERDAQGQTPVVLINRALARSGFLGPSPVGVRIYPTIRDTAWHVVGIVEDVRQQGLDQAPVPQIFVSARQFPIGNPSPYFAIRARGGPAELLPAVRNALHDVDQDAFVDNVATMEAVVSNSLARPRLFALMLGVFALIAALLAAVGIYGVVSHSVSRRTREIGVRMAMGADRASVMRLVLGQSLGLTAVGLGIGLAGAIGVSRYLEQLLFGLMPFDVMTFAGMSVVFLLVAFVASWLPAYRAAAIGPLPALRSH
jgi:putative ABC transport system permease protein